MRTITLSPNHSKRLEPCQCGCAECQGNCCQLDCLERPRFYCGQLLTDQDLTALVRWTQDKFRLKRYRDGWGVVCGLDVYCDHKHEGRIMVGPGYAVSCCGDDIIVCKEDSLDLSDACRDDKDPCADPSNPEQKSQTVDRTVDIYIRYTDSRPKHSLRRDNCGQVGGCENSRTEETYQLHCKRVLVDSNPMSQVELEWTTRLRSCTEILRKYQSVFEQKEVNMNNLKDTLLAWLDEHPLHQFCYVRDWVCELPKSEDNWRQRLIEILFYIVMDCRNTFLRCDCNTCESDEGVLLARVRMKPSIDAKGHRQCHVLEIDPYPPYRRMLSSECWPAPLGKINLGRFIWHRWDEVCLELRHLGIELKKEPHTLSDTGYQQVVALFGDLWFAGCADSVVAIIVDDRVIGFKVAETRQAPRQQTIGEIPRKDDLQTGFKRLGPDREQKLNEQGICTFKDLANADPKKLKNMFPIESDENIMRWIEFARARAEGV
jgi:hypothetical protein